MTMIKYSKVLLMAIGQLVCGASFAEPARIYEASVAVADQGAAARARSFADAYSQVLAKATGDKQVQAASAQRDSGTISEAVAQYRYQVMPGTDADGKATKALQLHVSFKPEAIEAALAAMGRQPWLNRPQVLVWAVIDDGMIKRVADAAQADALKPFTEQAAELALPVKLPAMDEQDRSQVNAESLWSANAALALGAGARYGAPVALIARLGKYGNQWSAQFTLVDARQRSDWSSTYPDANQALKSLAIEAAKRLGQWYAAPIAQKPQELLVAVADIHNALDYGKVMSYLESMPALRSIDVQSLQGDIVLLKLDATLSLDGLIAILPLQNVLQRDEKRQYRNAQAVLRLVR